MRADVIFALLPFEMNALQRARSVRLAGRDVRVVTPEDLIVMKIISEIADAEGLTRRRIHELDLDYLDPLVREMAASLERPELLDGAGGLARKCSPALCWI